MQFFYFKQTILPARIGAGLFRHWSSVASNVVLTGTSASLQDSARSSLHADAVDDLENELIITPNSLLAAPYSVLNGPLLLAQSRLQEEFYSSQEIVFRSQAKAFGRDSHKPVLFPRQVSVSYKRVDPSSLYFSAVGSSSFIRAVTDCFFDVRQLNRLNNSKGLYVYSSEPSLQVVFR
ncbi:MAG: hypothetical protein ACMXYD_05255 [Candidatus Woesearchaeota archaeon]